MDWINWTFERVHISLYQSTMKNLNPGLQPTCQTCTRFTASLYRGVQYCSSPFFVNSRRVRVSSDTEFRLPDTPPSIPLLLCFFELAPSCPIRQIELQIPEGSSKGLHHLDWEGTGSVDRLAVVIEALHPPQRIYPSDIVFRFCTSDIQSGTVVLYICSIRLLTNSTLITPYRG